MIEVLDDAWFSELMCVAQDEGGFIMTFIHLTISPYIYKSINHIHHVLDSTSLIDNLQPDFLLRNTGRAFKMPDGAS
jgi:hypothetical protein